MIALLLWGGNSLLDARQLYPVGHIVKIKGEVSILRDWGTRRIPAKAEGTLFDGDVLETGAGAKAYLELKDGSRIVVDEKSRIEIVDYGTIHQHEGAVDYTINPREIDLKIVTDFATIGIRGTTFRVDVTDPMVTLTEGKLAIQSRVGPWTIRRIDPEGTEHHSRGDSFYLLSGQTVRFFDAGILIRPIDTLPREHTADMKPSNPSGQLYHLSIHYQPDDEGYQCSLEVSDPVMEEGEWIDDTAGCHYRTRHAFSCDPTRQHNVKTGSYRENRFLLIPQKAESGAAAHFECTL